MSYDQNAAGVGVGGYIPTPIARLTTHSVDQRILATLERIEALLIRATTTQVPQQGLHQGTTRPSAERGKRSTAK